MPALGRLPRRLMLSRKHLTWLAVPQCRNTWTISWQNLDLGDLDGSHIVALFEAPCGDRFIRQSKMQVVDTSLAGGPLMRPETPWVIRSLLKAIDRNKILGGVESYF